MDVKDGIGPLTDEDGNVISDNKDMAQVLNQYFTTAFTDENVNNIPESRCLCRDENSEIWSNTSRLETGKRDSYI